MFSMDAFCYHHKRLSKFGALKKALCFEGGGAFKGSRQKCLRYRQDCLLLIGINIFRAF